MLSVCNEDKIKLLAMIFIQILYKNIWFEIKHSFCLDNFLIENGTEFAVFTTQM